MSDVIPHVVGRDAALAAGATGRGLRGTLVRYYSLTKPRVLYANVLTAAAGFLFAAARGGFDPLLFAALVVGTTLVIASACVANNILDRDIDMLMARTDQRATVTGGVDARIATVYSVVLGVVGIVILALWTNWPVVIIGLVGFVDYVLFYGVLSKRMSVHGTLVGAISGAVPILAGYVAVTGRIDLAATILFAVMFLWQMPAFYSIAIYRREEYARAGVPVISVIKGEKGTRIPILVYTIATVVTALLLPAFGYAGIVYTAVVGVLGAWWIILGIQGVRAADTVAWSHRMFRLSLIVLLVLCAMWWIGPLLP